MNQSLRPYIRLIITGVGILFVVWLVLFLKSYGWIEIKTDASTLNGNTVNITLTENGDEKSFELAAGKTKKLRVKAGTIQVESSAANIRAVDVVAVHGLHTTKVTVPKGSQHAIKQLGSYARFCPAFAGDQLYSYDCNGSGPIIKHTAAQLGNSRNTTLFDEQNFESLKPIQGGLIGYSLDENGNSQLQYVDLANESVRQIALPEGLPSLTDSSLPDIIAPANTNKQAGFALVFTQKNRIYLFNGVDDQSPVLIEPKPGKLSDNFRISRGSFSSDGHFVLYLGVSSEVGDGTTDATSTPDLQNYLLEYDSAGKPVTSVSLPKDISDQGMYKLSNNFYAADSIEGFDFYYRKNDAMQLIYHFPNMAGWTLDNDKAYVQVSSTLYEFTPKENGQFSLESRFTSSSIRVSGVYTTTKGLVFTGFAGSNTSAPLNVYQLLSDTEPSAASGEPSKSRIEPDFTDLSRLTDGGLSAFQTVNLQYAIDGYLNNQGTIPAKVQVSNIQIASHDPESASTSDSLTFDLTLGDTSTLKATVEYSSIVTIHLWLHDNGGGLVYDSGVITGSQPQL